jgi:N-acetyl sugar amidotransferase
MKVLIVCSGNNPENNILNLRLHHAFIYEQVILLEREKVEFDFFFIEGKGFFGYIKSWRRLWTFLKKNKFAIIHAHYGLSGFIAVLQPFCKTIITFHGSDINQKSTRLISNFACFLANYSIFVSPQLCEKLYVKPSKNYSVIPCGINLDLFYPVSKNLARQKLNLLPEQVYILFSSYYENPVKNYPLAKAAVSLVPGATLMELKGFTREEVNLLLNAVDVLLLTSPYEGSPQVIKEAMACNCPVITTDVGDVRSILNNTEHCYICPPEPRAIAEKMKVLLNNPVRTNGRDSISSYDNAILTRRILNIYRRFGIAAGYQKCKAGLWDTSVPGITFDDYGISNYAGIQQHLMKDYPLGVKGKEDWLKIAEEIKKKGKENRYDCVIGVSGGTDSSYLLHIAKEFGLRPLAVNLDNGWNSDIAVKNIKKITSALQIDLETYVIDYEEIKDLLRAFMRAELPWIDTPTDLAIQSVLYKTASREKIRYILIGNDFRSEGKQPTEWTYGDQRILRHLHRKFGKVKLKTFPLLSLFSLVYLGYVRGIKMIPPFNFIDYDKPTARRFLIEKYGWEYYGEHHHENLFTKWAIGYWEYEKFGIDKRIITYSAQILNNKITREEAIGIISKPPYNEQTIKQETEYVLKKLEISDSEFNSIWVSQNRSFMDYPSYYKLIQKLARLIVPVLKYIIPLKPKIFYEMEGRS